MKIIIFVMVCALNVNTTWAALSENPQLNERVNNTSGGYQSGGPYTLLGSMGENIIGSMGDGVNILICGFLQAIGVFNQSDIKAKLPAGRIAWAVNNKIDPTKGEETIIQFRVKDSRKRVTIKIYSMLGEFIKTVVDREYEPLFSNTGNPLDDFWSVTWNGKNVNSAVVGSGIYLIRVKVGDQQEILKAAVVK